ncbi:cyanidin-3-O-glucoside 2-O-glucuronosyltransferase-like [Pyrus ussuriensis x Pyrus communis]|uniref:Cyanidin-3-O-glucoside 2-O-glucuronosyltransferase-like n=1 Tax=Pyrus ussuriensis x Pyrus communis TaxID=2448454 RepID=A0A5N5GQA1_9ROSA|nr:cyanidin-3-O-glucoside 2-O-glucuronosyltransferase-like [Pyrus ussuriensis x Pyrus communis]
MNFGVPIIAMPIHLDKPFNARLVEELGIGVEVMKTGGSVRREGGRKGDQRCGGKQYWGGCEKKGNGIERQHRKRR